MTHNLDVERARGEARQSFAAFAGDLACRVVVAAALVWLGAILVAVAGRLVR